MGSGLDLQRHHDTALTRDLITQQRLPDPITGLNTAVGFHQERWGQLGHQFDTRRVSLAHHHAPTPLTIPLFDLRWREEDLGLATGERLATH